MTRTWMRSLPALVAGGLLVGCAAQTVEPPAASAPPAGIQSAGHPAPPAAARAAAASLLAAFRPPPGATRLAHDPSPLPRPLSGPGMGVPSSSDLVVSTEWWSYPGTAEQAVAWIEAHQPRGTTANGSAQTTSDTPSGTLSYERPLTDQLDQRSLEIGYDQIGNRTLLRADAVVVWLPARPAGATVPDTVTRITLVATPRGQSGGRPPRTVPLPTVTDRPTITKILALVNALPMAGEGTFSCPNDDGSQLRMSFYAGAGTTPLAVADVRHSGCGGVDLSVSGGPQRVGLGDPVDLISKVASLVGTSFPTLPPTR